MSLTQILQDSAYRLTQFKSAYIAALEARITWKQTEKASIPYVTCLVRGKQVKLTPEETVRQLYVMVLKDELGYPVTQTHCGRGSACLFTPARNLRIDGFA